AVIFEVGEHQVLRLAQEDRVVADVAVGDLGQDGGPDVGVEPLVLGDVLRLDAEDQSHALHCQPPCVISRVNSATLLCLIASQSQSIPRPGSEGATACPSTISIRRPVNSSSCGMYSTYFPF